MKHSIILDACTIINLLRIDEEDEFIFKSLKLLDLNIATLVYEEVNSNVRKNPLTEEQKKYIDQRIPQLLQFTRKTDDIINDISKDFFEQIRKFTKHKKKDNGELISSVLSLCISRENNSKVYFYTDDFSAKTQFAPFFSFQQIGMIGDSIDLLLFLHWSISDFDKKCLRKYLQDLKSEYNVPLKKLVSKIQSRKDSFSIREKKDKTLMENMDKVLTGYWEFDPKIFSEGLSFFNGSRNYSDIKGIISQFPNVEKERLLARKVRDTMDSLSSYNIFKIV
jgi:membrane-associated HD superfamily phosphohydrolase